MLRTCWATLAVAATLGLVSGCMNSSRQPWIGRHRNVMPPECSCLEGEGMPFYDGPILDAGGPLLVPGGSQGTIVVPPAANPMPEAGPAPTAPQPRLVPQPQPSSRPAPLRPVKNTF